MGIVTAIKSLFGKGKLKFKITLSDGRECIATTPYVGDINTLDLADVKRKLEFETGKRIIKIKLIDHLEQ